MSSVLRRLCCLLAALAALLPAARAAEVPRALVLPPGFTIELWAELEDARTLVLGGDGRTVYVGSRRAGTVTALRDTDGDGRADARWTLATGLTMPNGLAVRGDALYVADVDRLLRFARVEASFGQPVAPQVLRKDLPRDSAHGWRYLAFGPDGKLYLSIGAPCNVCEAPGYAELRRMDAEGRDEETVARGLRNSVGFAWRPGTRELWLTDNGRDWLGDDQPP
ncbi:MAG: sorbosone dehydrogenase family protein, partial [Proteobacteria bacterium]|nr:sorbosone dehydrogenase family protein [Pseudomonadota bacterium]